MQIINSEQRGFLDYHETAQLLMIIKGSTFTIVSTTRVQSWHPVLSALRHTFHLWPCGFPWWVNHGAVSVRGDRLQENVRQGGWSGLPGELSATWWAEWHPSISSHSMNVFIKLFSPHTTPSLQNKKDTGIHIVILIVWRYLTDSFKQHNFKQGRKTEGKVNLAN